MFAGWNLEIPSILGVFCSGEITYLGLQARGYFLGITILFEAT